MLYKYLYTSKIAEQIPRQQGYIADRGSGIYTMAQDGVWMNSRSCLLRSEQQ